MKYSSLQQLYIIRSISKAIEQAPFILWHIGQASAWFFSTHHAKHVPAEIGCQNIYALQLNSLYLNTSFLEKFTQKFHVACFFSHYLARRLDEVKVVCQETLVPVGLHYGELCVLSFLWRHSLVVLGIIGCETFIHSAFWNDKLKNKMPAWRSRRSWCLAENG